MNEDEITRIVEQAVKATFLSLGVITDDHSNMVEVQQDFAWIRRERRHRGDSFSLARNTSITVLISAIGIILWEGFKALVQR